MNAVSRYVYFVLDCSLCQFFKIDIVCVCFFLIISTVSFERSYIVQTNEIKMNLASMLIYICAHCSFSKFIIYSARMVEIVFYSLFLVFLVHSTSNYSKHILNRINVPFRFIRYVIRYIHSFSNWMLFLM